MIRRTRTHGFDIKDAVSLDFLENLYNNDPRSVAEYHRPTDFGLDDILVLEINDHNAISFKNGGFVQLTVNNERLTVNDLRRVYCDNKFIGIGSIENGILKPMRVIN